MITHLLATKEEQPILLGQDSVRTLATIAHNVLICKTIKAQIMLKIKSPRPLYIHSVQQIDTQTLCLRSADSITLDDSP